jgi:hypothetical protein
MRFSTHLSGEWVLVHAIGIKVLNHFRVVCVVLLSGFFGIASASLVRNKINDFFLAGFAELAIWQNKHLMKQLQSLTP